MAFALQPEDRELPRAALEVVAPLFGVPRVFWGPLLLVLLLGASCKTKLEDGVFHCDPDQPGSCPSGFACMELGPTHRCFSKWQQSCLNGELEAGEQCDGTDFGGGTCRDFFPNKFPEGTADRNPFCTSTCKVSCGICGDGVVDSELGEQCDRGDANSDEPDSLCRTSCLRQVCGDGIVDSGRGEECDGGAALQVSCRYLGYNSGTISRCTEFCRFDRSPCIGFCGDGSIGGEEECDGADTGLKDCVSFGGSSGRLGCDPQCRRQVEACPGLAFEEVHTNMGSSGTISGLWVAPDETAFVGLTSGRVQTAESFGLTHEWDFEPETVIMAVSGRDATEVWAATSAGLHRFDGSSWSLERSGSSVDVIAVGAADVYATAEQELVHYDGAEWRVLYTYSSPLMPNEGKIWADPSGVVFAREPASDALIRYQGGAWAEVAAPIGHVHSLWGPGPDELYLAAGGDLKRLVGGSLLIERPGQGSPEHVSVWGAGADEVYSFRADGSLDSYDGSVWSSQVICPSWSGVIGGSGKGDLWLGINDELKSMLLRREAPQVWRQEPSGTTADLSLLWASGSSDVWAAGKEGTVIRRVAGGWAADGPAIQEDVLALDGLEGGLPLVATATGLWRRGAAGWTALPSPPATVTTILVAGEGEVYAGAQNRILRFDGAAWSTFYDHAETQPGESILVQSLWRDREGRLLAGGGRCNGTCDSTNGAVLLTVDGLGGAAHMLPENPTTASTRVLPIKGLGEGWALVAVAEGGIAMETWFAAGSGWALQFQGLADKPFHALWATSASDIYGAGIRGSMSHFDGTAWSRERTGVQAHLRAVRVAPDGSVFAAGDAGTIIRRDAPGPVIWHGCGGSGAVDLFCGMDLVSSTAGLGSGLDQHAACGDSPGGSAGPDVTYRLRPPPGTRISISLELSTGPIGLYLYPSNEYGDCAPLPQCLASLSLPAYIGERHELVMPAVLGADSYFLVVDTSLEDGVVFRLNVSCEKI